MTTRSQLESSIETWALRDDLSDDPVDFAMVLTMGENRLNRLIRAGVQEKSDTVTITGRSAALPTDFLEPRHAFVDSNANNYKFDYMTPEALRQSGVWDMTRKARFYTYEGSSGSSPDELNQITIAGPASVADPTTVDLLYWAKWALGANPTDTNWLLTNHFDLYLRACLVEAAILSHAWELEAKYEGLFVKSKEEFTRSENRKRFGAQSKKSFNPPRTAV